MTEQPSIFASPTTGIITKKEYFASNDYVDSLIAIRPAEDRQTSRYEVVDHEDLDDPTILFVIPLVVFDQLDIALSAHPIYTALFDTLNPEPTFYG